jgi:DNA topoisomerase-1
MEKNLVIVESPAKAKTIEKFLGNDYQVMSSYGHIRDLKEKEFGIDVDKNYKPEYIIPDDKKKLVQELKSASKKADMVWLASDEDREGEAIAWHLYETLGLKKENSKRIAFHEITKNAILNAIENPRDININLVDAQQARRVLDRIVGFELSPVLWRKIKPALSAGRVQSVAVKLIVDREREIQNFKTESSYRVVATFVVNDKNGNTTEMPAELNTRFKTEKEANEFLENCKNAEFTIENIVTKPSKRSPAPPFTTSTLQQEAARKLGYSVSQTMRLAQRLYESGQITYMRTDSVNLSSLAINTAKDEIVNNIGEKYWKARNFHTNTKGAQEAHEAIRPTYISRTKAEGTAQEQRLYELIWKRTIASQMADAEIEKTTATIGVSSSDKKFTAVGEVIKFDGFLKVYIESKDDDNSEDDSRMLPPLKKDEKLDMKQIVAQERFSQHPPRYTEATLVHKMEELGIGRPSTYAPTITVIQNRQYVERGDKEGEKRKYKILTLKSGKITSQEKNENAGAEKGKLIPTDIGIVVNDFLQEYFPNIMSYDFTANVEKQFDLVAEGKEQWQKTIDKFYKTFHPHVEDTMKNSAKMKGERKLGIDPKSGKPVVVKIGRFGPIAQIGETNDEEKPVFASLHKNQSIETITLDEALDLFKLPREAGEFEGKTMTIAVGRFGPYIRHDGKFYSIPKTSDPMTITTEEAQAIIEAKRQQAENNKLKTFEEDAEMQVLNGRFGPYIAYKGKNYKIAKGTDPTALTYEDAKKIIESESEKPAKKTFRRAAKKK